MRLTQPQAGKWNTTGVLFWDITWLTSLLMTWKKQLEAICCTLSVQFAADIRLR